MNRFSNIKIPKRFQRSIRIDTDFEDNNVPQPAEISMGSLSHPAVFGTAVNQNLAEVIFTGLEYRTFSMEFSMMPKSKREAKHP